MNNPFIWLILCYPFILLADPWGKDSDLVHSSPKTCTYNCQKPSLLARFGECAIQFHQEVISPADGPRSHFIPSSSQYTLEAMREYGFFTGYLLGCDRLMRENEELWVYRTTCDDRNKLIKYDPVPNLGR